MSADSDDRSEIGLRVIRELDAWSIVDSVDAPVVTADDCKVLIVGQWIHAVAGDADYMVDDVDTVFTRAAEIVGWDFGDPTRDLGELARLLALYAERYEPSKGS
jgi:hypothetical protein